MPAKLKQFCINGHDVIISGRDTLGRCKLCENKRHRDRYAAGLDIMRERSRERARLDRVILKEALTKEAPKTQKKLLNLVALVLLYGRIAQ